VTLFLGFFLGFFGGLRSLTAPAATAWAVYLGWLKLDGPLSLIGSTASVVIYTVLAVGELIADKLPWTPRRTAPLGLIARIVLGGLAGACLVPLMLPTLAAVAVMIFGAVSRQVGSIVLLTTGDSAPLSIVQLGYLMAEDYSAASVVGSILVGLGVLLALVVRKSGYQFGVHQG
jgi:uncharacterized membrane protein